MKERKPEFLIIGAMKCATTSVYEQMRALPGIFMPALKEPNFFSDDEVYAHGKYWYQKLFAEASPDDICGEASTHYTKLPTYPNTIERMTELLGKPRLIYVIRHPIDRLVSQYIHEWSQGNIKDSIEIALEKHPELVDYSCYGMQIRPYIDAVGAQNILLVHYEDIKNNPQPVLNRICQFIGYKEPPKWQSEIAPSNISSQRIRRFPLDDFLINNPLLQFIRRKLIPQKFRDQVKNLLTMQKRPTLSEQSREKLTERFDRDLGSLGETLGIHISCKHYYRALETPEDLPPLKVNNEKQLGGA